jgi:hypothetical protein
LALELIFRAASENGMDGFTKGVEAAKLGRKID